MNYDLSSFSANKQPGIAGHVHYAKVSIFDTIAKLAASPSTPAEEVNITDPHTFAGTDGFKKMKHNNEEGMISAQGFGKRHSNGVTVTAELFVPGNKADFRAWLKAQEDSIFLVPHAECNGELVQIGTECNPAKLSPDWTWTSGKVGSEDAEGFNVKVYSEMSQVTYYTGVVTPDTTP